MTYCVGLYLNEGMVLLSDTRTNAGVDNIATYRKMFVFEEPGERVIAIMTAGSLSVTQTVMAKLEESIHSADASPETSIMQAPSILAVAEMVGGLLSDVSANISEKLTRINQSNSASASMILAGQRRGGRPRMFHLYQEGNFIEATTDTPYLQIGEHKYGKPLLDRVIRPETPLDEGKKAALLSMDSTMRSNLSVGMPLDLVVIKSGECKIHRQVRIEADNQAFRELSEAWSNTLRNGFKNIELPTPTDAR